MRRRDRIARVEAALLGAALMARAKGVTIVSDAFEAPEGVCVLGAANMFNVKLRLSKGHRLDSEWDSIEMGFDGVPLARARRHDVPIDRDFWRLGLRLREALQPVSASAGTS